jgi:hypothetical protein
MRNVFMIFLAVTISIPTVTLAQFSQICYPVGYPDTRFTTGYACVGYLPDSATIRVELLQAALPDGPVQVDTLFDVIVPATKSFVRQNSGKWGIPLLEAIAALPQVVAGPIHTWEDPYGYYMPQWRMEVHAVPGIRIGFRAISTSMSGQPLPPLPFMLLLSGHATAWPPPPQQYFYDDYAENYDCFGCYTPTIHLLGLVGCHIIACPPDWTGWDIDDEMVLSSVENDEIARMIPIPYDVPTVSEWGLIIIASLLLAAGAVVIICRRQMRRT